MIFSEIGRYPLIKINIPEQVFNNKICILFLIKLHEIFKKPNKTLLLRNQ